MNNKVADILTGIVSLLVAAAFYVQGGSLEFESKIFPLVLEVFLVITGAFLLVRGVLNKNPQVRDEEAKLAYGRAFIMIVATILYVVAINIVGFYVSSFIFLTLISFYLSDRGMNLKSFGISLGFAVILTVAVYGTFTLFLEVPTPAGILF